MTHHDAASEERAELARREDCGCRGAESRFSEQRYRYSVLTSLLLRRHELRMLVDADSYNTITIATVALQTSCLHDEEGNSKCAVQYYESLD
ncbi:unnamed protein product [Pieris macdunnoughi]|uniref:Uncharacterized protein n=1 Tax=Pieris macdunnoughi TaxID=345717 RepID=A0A821MWL8_9NEOP|nr:unnamed protein product [Pieris macdunnoughi]